MQDDEKYPIAVNPEGIEFRGEEKIAMPMSPGTPTRYPSFPPEYKTANLGDGTVGREVTRDGEFAGGLAEAQLPARNHAREPWWKKKTLVLLIVIIFTVIVVAIAGGIYARDHLVVKDTSEVTQSSQNNTLQLEAGNSTRDSVASSGLFLKDNTTWNMQIYRQLPSGSIVRQISLDGSTWKPATNVTLEYPAKNNSPIAATTSTDKTGVVYLTLFYITQDNSIARAGTACGATSANCGAITNDIISSRLTVPPKNDTGLAAVNVDNAQDWRVYFHDQDGMITELAGNASGFNTGSMIGGMGLTGSSIAATNVNSTTNNINVFYVDSLTQALYTMQFADGDWTAPKVLSPEAVIGWNPLSGLSSCYSATQDQLHTYWTGPDLKIYEFLGANASTTATVWETQAGHNHLWGPADYSGADITAVGWADQVRFFQVSRGKLVQGALDNTTWSEAFFKTIG